MRCSFRHPRVLRRLLIVAAVVLFVAVVAAVIVVPVLLGVDQGDLERLGLAGLFVANFLGTATVFVPVPGLTAAGQALIIAMATSQNPVIVALVGGAGMGLAEITAYLAGMTGRTLSEERRLPLRGRLGDLARRGADVVNRVMLRYGVLTLFVLSAIPNPLFEFAGITAGAVRMNFWRFLISVWLGKTIRAFILAFLGDVFF